MKKLLICLVIIICYTISVHISAQDLIDSIDSYDSTNLNDNDEVYIVGSRVIITVNAVGNRGDLSGRLSISSTDTGYSSGNRIFDNRGSGVYEYTWDTARLTPASDYTVSATLTDTANNETTTKTLVITLYSGSTLFKGVDSSDSLNPDDSDEYYHSGQKIRIIAEYANEPQPVGSLEISSVSTSYTSQTYTMVKGSGNTLEYEWDTTGLREASDYTVKIQLESGVFRATDNSLVISIDNTAPSVFSVKASDRSDSSDNDGIYHAGQSIVIDLQAGNRESGLEAYVRIKSDTGSYDSESQRMTDLGGGAYRYIWTTTGLNPAKDYEAVIVLRDKAGLESQDSTLVFEIDNTPPQNGLIIINDDDIYTLTRLVNLKISADDAVKMYVFGDVIDDVSSFEWIPYAESLKVNLSGKDGNKRVSVRFIDKASNESPAAEDTIILDEAPPVIKTVRSYEETDINDNDGIYHANQSIVIIAETDGSDPVDLDGSIQISSAITKYDSGIQKMRAITRGTYSFTWNTAGLVESSDYSVLIKLKDPSNREVSDRSLIINIDNTPPNGGMIKVNDGKEVTDTRSVILSISSLGEPSDMFIGGDVVDDSNTFEWVPYKENIVANLADGDGSKEVNVKFRDAAKNVSGSALANIRLDRKTPSPVSIIIADNAKYTSVHQVTLKIKASNANKMFIDGDVMDDDKTFEFIDYAETLSISLSPSDGEKRVGVIFRNEAGVVSNRIQDTIILDTTKPKITVVDSYDSANPQDNDEIYRAGQAITISVTTDEDATELSAKVRIRSAKVGYDTGEQAMSKNVLEFRYNWDTSKLQQSDDYAVWVQLSDGAGQKSEDTTLNITIDNSPPMPGQVSINEGADKTSSSSVKLNVTAEGVDSIFISGDVIKDNNTFNWIKSVSGLIINLSGADGKKTVNVKFRDAAGNESADVSASITLDRESPYQLGILVSSSPEGTTSDIYTGSRAVYLALSGKNAVEMYISGDVDRAFDTYKWVAYKPSMKVNLSGSDGEKVIYVRFRNQRLIESDQIESRIILDTSPPDNVSLTIQDANDPNDTDGHYHSGEMIRIVTECTEANDLDATIRISSQSADYDSGIQPIRTKTKTGNRWRLEYIWDTTDLKQGDYTLYISLTDSTGWSKESDSFIVIIDNDPPTNPKVVIAKGAKRTASRTVSLETEASDAVEMLVSGDIRRDNNTFQWVPVGSSILTLLTGDGSKNIGVKFRDKAENETDVLSTNIILSESPPIIERLDSWDTADMADNDEIYHAGQLIAVALKAQADEKKPMIETGLNANLTITSTDGKYKSGNQKAREESGGWYTYIWDTNKLAAGKYTVNCELSDGVGHEVTGSMSIDIDNIPPKDAKISINEKATRARAVTVNFQVKDASLMYIDGDVMKDKGVTLEWIPYTTAITVRLKEGDGTKQIQARFKDDAGNITEPVYAQITLDTVGPKAVTVKISDNETGYTSSSTVSLSISAEDAARMYISGDILSPDISEQWIPFDAIAKEQNQKDVGLNLTDDEGEKIISVELEDAVGNRSGKVTVSIILDTKPPKIKTVKSVNASDNADNDGRYLEGVQVIIRAETEEANLSNTISIRSLKTGYASAVQNMDGNSYTWDTRLLQPSDDYTVRIEAKDKAGNLSVDESLVLVIFDKPQEFKLTINEGEMIVHNIQITKSQLVKLSLSADNASEMNISGDILDDENTLEWVKFSESLSISLTPEDGDKKIKVEFRDINLRIIGSAESSIRLDQNPPKIAKVYTSDSKDSYKAGDMVEIIVVSARLTEEKIDASDRESLEVEVQIRSPLAGYDSGLQRAVKLSDLSYAYTWDTSSLKENDYGVEVVLTDEAGWTSKDYSLSLSIDISPPTGGSFSINGGEKYTQKRSVRLAIEVPEDASEMLISGDLVKDSNTFAWIPIKSEIIVNLAPVDKEKSISVRFRDKVGNESELIKNSIGLNELPPVIRAVESRDSEDATDSDGIYHAGQKVKIIITVDDTELTTGDIKDSKLEAYVSVRSDSQSTNTSEVRLNATRDSISAFSALWDTSSLPESLYRISVRVQDNYGQEATNNNLEITIDNTSPEVSLKLEDGKDVTNSYDLALSVRSSDAKLMYISGDVAESFTTFKWIPYTETRKITLTDDNGLKNISVKVKDQAGNVSEALASITLDRTAPGEVAISTEKYTEVYQVRLTLSAKGAREMIIGGDVVDDDKTFEWIPYQKEIEVRLASGEGEKTIYAKFRNGEVESKEVSTNILLDYTSPVINKMEAFDSLYADDNDLKFSSGQNVAIRAHSEAGLKASVIIISPDYNSGKQNMTELSGVYTFLWNTEGLSDGIYSCEISVEDSASHITSGKIEIEIDSRGPSNPSIVINAEEDFVFTRTIEVSLSADGDPTEVYISGDVVDDDTTFQWIPFKNTGMKLNLRGADGEKKINAKFRSVFRSESSQAEAIIKLELKRPELKIGRIIQSGELAYLTLRFDEPIVRIDPKAFFVTLKDKLNPENVISLDGDTNEVTFSNDTVVVEMSSGQLDSIKRWQPISLATSYIKSEIAENGAYDIADSGNISNQTDVYFAVPETTMQVSVDPRSFSPNGDNVKDKILILYSLARDSDVVIRITDSQKNVVMDWKIDGQAGGTIYPLEWDGKNNAVSLPDGLYSLFIISSGIEANSPSYGLKKEFSIDNSSPQILEVRPWQGAEIPSLFKATVKVVDMPESSGIESVYATLDNDIETKFAMVKSSTDIEYTIPANSTLIIPPGKHSVTFHAVDMAENKAEKTVNYVVVAEIKTMLDLMSFPNPFRPGNVTTIRYSLPEKSQSGEIAIYDSGGDMVFFNELSTEDLEAGEHTLQWDGKDTFGRIMGRGVYFCRLRAGDKSKTHKIAIR